MRAAVCRALRTGTVSLMCCTLVARAPAMIPSRTSSCMRLASLLRTRMTGFCWYCSAMRTACLSRSESMRETRNDVNKCDYRMSIMLQKFKLLHVAFPQRLAAQTTAGSSLAALRGRTSLPPRGPAKPREVGTTTPSSRSSFSLFFQHQTWALAVARRARRHRPARPRGAMRGIGRGALRELRLLAGCDAVVRDGRSSPGRASFRR
eukprot:COSAG03_NODE_3184_length_2155_cov_53.669747_2_plen_206_part_00